MENSIDLGFHALLFKKNLIFKRVKFTHKFFLFSFRLFELALMVYLKLRELLLELVLHVGAILEHLVSFVLGLRDRVRKLDL